MATWRVVELRDAKPAREVGTVTANYEHVALRKVNHDPRFQGLRVKVERIRDA